MSADIEVCAPAKINIGLNIREKRPDGFHNIEGIFQTVTLYDRLYVSVLDKKRECIVECEYKRSGNSFSLPENNTLTAAYDAFCELTGCDFGVKVKIEKNIPAGSGLGGGSSDAASFIKALAFLAKTALDEESADKIAEKVGSDVFFFLRARDEKKRFCALVSGRGEIVKPITARDDLSFVIVFPQIHSSTKEAYELIDRAYAEGNRFVCPEYEELESIYNSPVKNWIFVNVFTSLLAKKYPQIGNALKEIKAQGASQSDMSGSGSAVFGVFDNKSAAERAFALLKQNRDCCIAR